ncbi:methyltransferase domain-containing protein [Allosphingosinicella deserti]|uniref:SAM-dependent methyltransferase n=1 Tax=Allosphingosinicella deserti TaxID=2116704 RepID=A0A2P7QP43_9SPHN|nr:methyltransferase domain-containing protein [Sphingomonas deserti]PSJ39739.1 SAM-dependent methyltransferase [Sphingomonas deserti]
MSHDTPFDRRLRRLRRDRAAGRFADADYLHRLVADELLDRLDSVTLTFERALVLGAAGGLLGEGLRARGIAVTYADPSFAFAHAAGGVQCDEDRLPFADSGFDLVLSIGLLDTVNDLPGALLLIRRALVPDGLFLAAFAGAGTLPRLRSAMMAADTVDGGIAAHIHPQIDVRAAGDLLTRAGFALPVVDSHGLDVRFSGLMSLLDDLRAMGATNVLEARAPRPVSRYGLAAAIADFASHAGPDGKTAERFEILHLLGWAPAPSQPKPAKRGSATTSLAAVLKPR